MEKLSSMLSARSNQMETLGNLREELVRFIPLSNSHSVESRWWVSKASFILPASKVAQNSGVGYRKKDPKNLPDQVAVGVCHRERVLFQPQLQKCFVSGCHRAVLTFLKLLCVHGRAGGIQHTSQVLPTVCTKFQFLSLRLLSFLWISYPKILYCKNRW